jgi:hypothetical protein
VLIEPNCSVITNYWIFFVPQSGVGHPGKMDVTKEKGQNGELMIDEQEKVRDWVY